jgi:exosome complex component RRP4
MINLISEKTGCDVQVGQNGVIVVVGPPEGIVKTANVIKMIDKEVNGANLMRKVEEYLGGSSGGS